MKIQGLLVLLIAYGPLAFGAGNPKPFQTINLNNARSRVNGCTLKLGDSSPDLMAWIDDEHLAAYLVFFCTTQDGSKDEKFQSELAVFNLNGHSRVVSKNNEFLTFNFLQGPVGTLLVGDGGQVKLMDSGLRIQQTLKCPEEATSCGIFTPSSHSITSDFALCSKSTSEEICDFYRGHPAEKVETEKRPFNKIIRDPYKSMVKPAGLRPAWKVSQFEEWYFDDHGRLMRRGSDGDGPVSTVHWTPEDSGCEGELSASDPRRFLAVCTGEHIYTDGAFDNIFGYSRIALFDVASRRILVRIDGPAYTQAALSPSGKLIAVAHGSKIRLYRVN